MKTIHLSQFNSIENENEQNWCNIADTTKTPQAFSLSLEQNTLHTERKEWQKKAFLLNYYFHQVTISIENSKILFT